MKLNVPELELVAVEIERLRVTPLRVSGVVQHVHTPDPFLLLALLVIGGGLFAVAGALYAAAVED